jgi:hypothetical protein
MPVICPTCQIPFNVAASSRPRAYSSPWTGGALFFARGAWAGLTGGGELTLAVVCICATEASRVVRRARAEDADRRIPQEREIEGPAVYPINAPATAPTGPRTTAPDTAPRAASPARSSALVSNDTNDPTIRVIKNTFLTVISPAASQDATHPRNAAGPRYRLHSLARFGRLPD